MKNKIKNIVLILFCLYSLFYVICSLATPILAHFSQFDIGGIIDSWFVGRCHRQPDRTFWLFSYPMSICCRCFGFYLGVVFTSILALFNKLNITIKTFVILCIIAIIDIIINFIFGINLKGGNYIRFIVGIIMSLIFTTSLCYLFNRKWRKEQNEN